MKILRFSSQYKRDVKRYRHKPEKMLQVFDILEKLKNEIPIPVENKPHPLKGNYKGCMECHIEDDFLLIWIDETSDQIGILRLGSHSELFKK